MPFLKAVGLLVLGAFVGLVIGDVYGAFGLHDWIEDRLGNDLPCPVGNYAPSTGEPFVLSEDAVILIHGNDTGASGSDIDFWICRDANRDTTDFAPYWYWGTNSAGEPILFPLDFDDVDQRWSAHGFIVDCPEGDWRLPLATGGFHNFDPGECP